jgi:integrase
MAVFKKGKNWYIDYYFSGRRKREMIGPNKKLAESVLAKRRLQIAENKFLDIKKRGKIKFEELGALYLDYSKTNKRSWTRDRTSIGSLKAFFNGKYLYEITPLLIERYKKKRIDEVSPASVNRELACLKHMFTKGIEWDMTDSNPVKKVKLLRESNERLRYLSSEQAIRLFENCPAHLKPIVLTALYTGMRKSEILKLKWEAVDLEHRIIFVKDTKNNQVREIPINNLLTSALKEIRFKSPYVFSNKNGRPYGTVRKSFEGAVKKADIKDFRFHDLRHTFASHLVMSRVDLMTVKELLGHKTIKMTLRYAHLPPSHKRRAIESLEYFDGHPDGHQRDLSKVKQLANSLI